VEAWVEKITEPLTPDFGREILNKGYGKTPLWGREGPTTKQATKKSEDIDGTVGGQNSTGKGHQPSSDFSLRRRERSSESSNPPGAGGH